MKKLLFLLLIPFLCFFKQGYLPYSVHPPVSKIKVLADTGASSTNGDNVTCQLTSSYCSLIAVQVSDQNAGSGTLTDNNGNIWVLVRTDGTGFARNYLYYCNGPNTSIQPHTFTFANVGHKPAMNVVVLSGTAPVSPLDVQSGSNGSGTTINVGSLTPTQNGDIILAGLCFFSPSTSQLATAPFQMLNSKDQTANSNGRAFSFYIQQTAASINPQFVITSSSYGAGAFAFKSQ